MICKNASCRYAPLKIMLFMSMHAKLPKRPGLLSYKVLAALLDDSLPRARRFSHPAAYL